jgi:hypothetical protein
LARRIAMRRIRPLGGWLSLGRRGQPKKAGRNRGLAVHGRRRGDSRAPTR